MHNVLSGKIDSLFQSGLSAVDLVSYMLPGIAWLADHQNDKFRLCYHGADGSVVVEEVRAAALVGRAQQLGWTPESPDAAHPECMFGEAIYHLRRGVHWYATACDDTTEMLPLAFPARELAAAKRREEKFYSPEQEARREKERQRLKMKKQAAEEKAANAELEAAVDLAASDFIKQANQAGKEISLATARRKAWRHIKKCDDWTYHLLLKRLRAAGSKEAR